ncbi:unnamed protein product [Mytilus edulis]|uniref:ATP-dependent DNA helicase n=1 Tax=Mytilus edulis TaxID=6550 RepID=A0A8S3QRK0_MYTED|nr:unnamed protein product [Mytilus edulis]
MRVRTNNSFSDEAFENFLLRIGNGTQQILDDGQSTIELPRYICIETNDNELQKWIDSVYPNLKTYDPDNSYLGTAILTTKNENVDKINTLVMNQFPATPTKNKVYPSADTVADEDQQGHYPNEFLNSLTPSGTPPHKLYLKKKAIHQGSDGFYKTQYFKSKPKFAEKMDAYEPNMDEYSQAVQELEDNRPPEDGWGNLAPPD